VKTSFQNYILLGYDAVSLGNSEAMSYPHVQGSECILRHFNLCLKISGSDVWSIIFQKNGILSYTAAEISKLTDLFFKLFWRGGVWGKIQRLFINCVMYMQETVPTVWNHSIVSFVTLILVVCFILRSTLLDGKVKLFVKL